MIWLNDVERFAVDVGNRSEGQVDSRRKTRPIATGSSINRFPNIMLRRFQIRMIFFVVEDSRIEVE